MRSLFRGEDEAIVVAVALDEHSEALVDSAVAICRRTSMQLRLVHVCQPEDGQSYLLPYFAHAERARLEEYLQKTAAELAARRLDDLRQRVTAEVSCSTRVMIGDPAEWINADAVSFGASMIMIGVGSAHQRFMPQAWSTALTLMAHSSLPVLVTDKGSALHLPLEGRVRMLVADDLAEDSVGVIEKALQLAGALGDVDFHHLHASGLTEATIADALEAAMAAAHTGSAATLSAQAMHATVKAQIRSALIKRMERLRPILEQSNGRYVDEVLFGDVQESIAEARQRIDPHILIFGRHQRIHHKPFLIGRVPFQTMVSQNKPVMIVHSH
jgi:hypothetical protein